MVKVKEDLTGKRFGRWTVIKQAPDRYDSKGYARRYWYCRCECEKQTEREVWEYSLINGISKSCGCYQKEVVKDAAKKNRKPFKYEIGQSVKTNLGSITITNKIRDCKKGKGKYYFYQCDICGYICDEDHVISEKTLNNGHGCSICGGGSAVQKGINDIGATAPWMLPYFKNKEDAYTRSIGCGDMVDFKCINCGYEFSRILANAYNQGLHCPMCDDGYHYPEKFIISLLEQLHIKYKFQLTKTTFKWCGKYKYDFYLPDYKIIIETHGEQHYFNNGAFRITVEEQQEIDKIKENLAIKNGLKYIAINCSYSKLDWIKKSIINELSNIFDLSNVNWEQCHAYALKNLTKEVCDYYMNNNKPSTIEISKHFPISYGTIRNYLLDGVELGWCDYNPQTALQKSRKNNKNTKAIEAWYKDEYIGIFERAGDLVEYAQNKYNIQLAKNRICETCNGKSQTTKGFRCRYI